MNNTVALKPEKINGKFKKSGIVKAVRKMLLDTYTSIYKWEGLPEGVRSEYAELYIAKDGCCFIGHAFDVDLCAMVNRGGAPDVYGLGTTPIISTRNGQVLNCDGTEGDVVIKDGKPIGVICYGNNTKTAQPLIKILAAELAEAITSLHANIIHSRYAPIYAVSDDVIKKATENAMSDIIEGTPVVIMANNILNEIEGVKNLEIVDLTDVNRQDKIQYISKTIDDLLRWFLSCYGQAVQGNSKMAQQTVDEVNGTTSASFILTELGFRWRKRAADALNENLGWNVSISYNKPWAVESEKYTEDIEDDPEEPPEADPEEPPEEDPADPEEPPEEKKEDEEEKKEGEEDEK